MAQQPSRLTVVEHVYHQNPGEDPTHIQTAYDRVLATDEQPYERQLTALEEWRSLDCGWLDAVSQIVIENKERDSGRIVLLSYADDDDRCWQIGPRESMRGRPSDIRALRFRGLDPPVRFSVHLIPE